MIRCDCELLLHYADCPYDGPDYTAARFDELVDRLAASEAARAVLVEAFVKHRTATHEVAPKFCKTCRESDAAIAIAAQPAAPAPGEAE